MNNPTAQHAGLAVRASDAEREQTVALLQRNFADGRLTLAELEERAGAAYKAQTRAELRDLIADLPAAKEQPPRPGMVLDPRLLCILLCVHPPAALVYWLLCRRNQAGTGPQPATTQRRKADPHSHPELHMRLPVDHSGRRSHRRPAVEQPFSASRRAGGDDEG